MEITEELKKWTESLSVAEKRFVKLQGKIRSGSDSQLLSLFDWLNRTGENDALPRKAGFVNNLPTLAVRLRALMLDSLMLLHKDDNVAMQLNSMFGEIQIMQSKKLNHAVSRQIKKAKKLAKDYSRYSYLLLLIENELQSAQKLSVDQFAENLKQLREEENETIDQLRFLRELHHIHDQMLLTARQYSFSLDPEILRYVKELAEVPLVDQAMASASFLENAIAVNILGIRDMFIRDPDAAVPRYQKLIRNWQLHPEWQKDQPLLLLTICRYYQNVCIFSPVDHDRINADLTILKGFSGLPKGDLVLLQDLLYSNQFMISLNTGKFELLEAMIDEINLWIKKQESSLTENQILPYLCNFVVAEFLSGNFAKANRFVNEIINRHDRKNRIDIYDFALIMRIVLQFELSGQSLNEYLIRSGKRHFSKNKYAADFELMVFKHFSGFEEVHTPAEQKELFRKFMDALDKFAKKLPPTIPLLGLNELSMWAESKLSDTSLKTIFLTRVEANLRMLETQAKVG